jgi:hypothetical protein
LLFAAIRFSAAAAIIRRRSEMLDVGASVGLSVAGAGTAVLSAISGIFVVSLRFSAASPLHFLSMLGGYSLTITQRRVLFSLGAALFFFFFFWGGPVPQALPPGPPGHSDCQQPKNQPTPRRTELRHGAFPGFF